MKFLLTVVLGLILTALVYKRKCMSDRGGFVVGLCTLMAGIMLLVVQETMQMAAFWDSLPKPTLVVKGSHATVTEYFPQRVEGGSPEWLCRLTENGFERHPDLRQESCGEYRAHIRRWINFYFATPLAQRECWCMDPCAREMQEEYPCGPGQSL